MPPEEYIDLWKQVNILNGHDELDEAVTNYVTLLETLLIAVEKKSK